MKVSLALLFSGLVFGCASPYRTAQIKPDLHEEVNPSRLISNNAALVQVPSDQLWDSVLETLVEDYTIESISERNGLVTTSWNLFYFQNRLYRNRISAKAGRAGWRASKLVFANKVQLWDPTNRIWVPSEDIIQESQRFLNNIIAQYSPKPPSGETISQASRANSSQNHTSPPVIP